MFIEQLKKKYKVNEPIFTNEILDLFSNFTRAYVFRLIDKANKSNELIQFDNGVYYLPEMTIFGQSTITADDVVMKKYICDNDDVFGIYSGLKLLNIFSITTQMPNTIEIVSNNETMRCRRISINGRNFILRKSRCPITKENVNAYIILQVFNDLNNEEKLNNWSKKELINFIVKNQITQKQIMDLTTFFPASTAKKIIMNGVLNEIA